MGVERFLLYNNGARDAHRKALAPYVADGSAVVNDWPVYPAQVPAYADCISRHRNDARWIAFLDLDEFLFSPTGGSLPEVLAEYERWPGVGVCRAFFGTSGHRKRPPGLVIESYQRRQSQHGGSLSVKSIVDPARTTSPDNPHRFSFSEGQMVDEQKRQLEGWRVESLSYSKLRINHYWTRSEQEARTKFARLRPDTGEPYPDNRQIHTLRGQDRRFGEPDDTIQVHVPALRQALQRTEERWGPVRAPAQSR